AQGRGILSGKPPESTHCNNIGPEQRKGIYAALQRWFAILMPEEKPRERWSAQELTCLTPDATEVFRPRPIRELAAELGEQRLAAARVRLAKLTGTARRQRLRLEGTRLLGDLEPETPRVSLQDSIPLGDVTLSRLALQVEPRIVVPLLLLLPSGKSVPRLPVVVAVAQGGKQEFLRKRTHVVAGLLKNGVAVCLPDLRGTGETRPGDARGRTSPDTDISSSELMLGQ